MLSQEVANTPPMLVVERRSRGPVGAAGQSKSRLQEAEDQLRLLLLKDTEQHPDVVAQKKLIESLRSSREGAAPANGSAGKGGATEQAALADASKRSVPNPVYEQMKVRLIEADTALSSLQRQRSTAAQLLDKLEKVRGGEQPGLLAEYQNMDRDYSVLRKNYEELLARLQSANLAQAADTQADKVKLQIVDPPETPRLPAAPNRLLLVSGVLFAGLGGRFGDHRPAWPARPARLSTVDDLRGLGLPVLGGISTLGQLPFMQRFPDGRPRFQCRCHRPCRDLRGTDASHPSHSGDLVIVPSPCIWSSGRLSACCRLAFSKALRRICWNRPATVPRRRFRLVSRPVHRRSTRAPRQPPQNLAKCSRSNGRRRNWIKRMRRFRFRNNRVADLGGPGACGAVRLDAPAQPHL